MAIGFFLLVFFQPVMSPSVLDKIIRQEKKIPPEYSTAENCVEMQVGALLNLYVSIEQKFLFTSMFYE